MELRERHRPVDRALARRRQVPRRRRTATSTTRPRATCARGTSCAASAPSSAIGGLDAHQVGIRVGRWVPLRLMSLQALVPAHPHARPDRRRAEPRDRVRRAARGPLLHRDGLARARARVHLRVRRRDAARAAAARGPDPAPARRHGGGDGVRAPSSTIPSRAPGAYRVEAYLPAYGRERTWILSNPIYVPS